MIRLIRIAAVAMVIGLTSCQFTKSIGSVTAEPAMTAAQNVLSASPQDFLASTDEIPKYTPAELKEEKEQTVYNIFNIPQTLRDLGKRSKNLYAVIDKWYGTPYRYGGTTDRGIDCSAFMGEIYKNVYKFALPRTAAMQFGITKSIKNIADLREGDLVFFKIHTSRISHVGIYLADGKFAHASSSQGVTISSLETSYWQRYYAGGGRIEDAVYALH